MIYLFNGIKLSIKKNIVLMFGKKKGLILNVFKVEKVVRFKKILYNIKWFYLYEFLEMEKIVCN